MAKIRFFAFCDSSKKIQFYPLTKVYFFGKIVGISGEKWRIDFYKGVFMYFIGNDVYSVDHKGRVFIPAKFRAVLVKEDDASFYITRGFESSLLLFPLSKWDEFIERLTPGRYSQKRIRDAIRALSFGAEHLPMDSQGRVILPKELREFARIDEEVFFLGALDKVELWSPSVYEEYTKDKGDISDLFSMLDI